MATNFPTSLDSFNNPSSANNLDDVGVVHNVQHTNINDAVTAVETKLGADGSAVTSTIDYLLKNTASVDPGHKHSASSLNLSFSTGTTLSGNIVTGNLSTGVTGGQTAVGGTASGNNLTLSSTTAGTKGKILFGTSAYDEVNNRLILGATSGFGRLMSALDVPGTYNSTETISQLVLSGTTDTSKQLRLGYDTTNNQGYIQATRWGLSPDTLLINPAFPFGSVGIGVATGTTPSSLLQVAGTITINGFNMATGAVNTYVLTSDASGNGTWQAQAGGGPFLPLGGGTMTGPILFNTGANLSDTSGFDSVGPNERQLYDVDGSTVRVDWGQGVVTFNLAAPIGTPSIQGGGNGNMILVPDGWGSTAFLQHIFLGDAYHSIVNIYGGGFFFSTYPGSSDPLNFGCNYDQAFGLNRGSGLKIIPNSAVNPTLQTLIGNNVFSTSGDGTTGLQVMNDMKLAGKQLSYNNILTAGNGMPAIYGYGRFTAQTAAKATVATFTPTVDSSFVVSANVLVTTSTVHNFTVTCSYTDESNTARVLTLSFSSLAGTFLTAIANAGGAAPYEGVPLHIRTKANTSVTIGTTGTFTTVTYNVEGSITQIA